MLREIQWLRVVVAAFVVELGIAVLAIPLQLYGNQTSFFGAVIVCCAAVPFVVTLVALRKVRSRLIAHGALIGVAATLMYFALVLATLGSIGAAADVYGTPLFAIVNGLRVLGAIAGGYAARRNRPPAPITR
jgi:hypothetical protein